jgi:hypothetical protein
MFSAKKITLSAGLAALVAAGLFNGYYGISIASATDALSSKAPAKPAAEKAEKKEAEKKENAKAPEVDLSNAVTVTPEELVKHPHEYLGKNVKFNANFFAFSNLALDYKPAYRSSKTHLSLLVLAPGTHIPLSELKLAMMIPKDKDPETDLLTKLKDGDQIEIVGKEFSTALDDPWVEIFKLKKIGGSKDDDKTASAEKEKSSKSDKDNADHHPDVEGK